MLYETASMTQVNKNIHPKSWKQWSSRLTSDQLDDIYQYINDWVDTNATKGVFNATQLLMADWNGTPLQVIHDVACDENHTDSARCYGIFVWHALCDREDDWAFQRYDHYSLKGMTYFRIHQVEEKREARRLARRPTELLQMIEDIENRDHLLTPADRSYLHNVNSQVRAGPGILSIDAAMWLDAKWQEVTKSPPKNI